MREVTIPDVKKAEVGGTVQNAVDAGASVTRHVNGTLHIRPNDAAARSEPAIAGTTAGR